MLPPPTQLYDWLDRALGPFAAHDLLYAAAAIFVIKTLWRLWQGSLYAQAHYLSRRFLAEHARRDAANKARASQIAAEIKVERDRRDAANKARATQMAAEIRAERDNPDN